MSLIRNTSSKKHTLLYGIAAILLVLIALFLGRTYHVWPFTTPATVTQTQEKLATSDEQVKAGAAIKQQVVDDSTSKNTSSDQGSSANTSAIEITSTNLVDDTYFVRTKIAAITSSGTCSLRMQGPDGKIYEESTGTQALATFSTCKGFNIPMRSLAKGSWQISITVTDGADSQTITKEVVL